MQESKKSASIISNCFQSIKMDFSILLKHVGVMNLKLILPRPSNIQGREPYFSDFVKNKNTIKLLRWLVLRNLPTYFFQNRYDTKDHNALHFVSVWMTLNFILNEKSKASVYIFSDILQSILASCHNLLVSCSSC